MKKIVLIVAAVLVGHLVFIGGAFLAIYMSTPEPPVTNTGGSPPAAPAAPVPASAPKASSLAEADLARAEGLFNTNCASCHTSSGKGEAHHRKDNIPDFTDTAWHARRSDAELVASIEHGKGAVMPSFQGKLSPDEVKLLVAYIRGFPGRGASPGAPPAEGHHHH